MTNQASRQAENALRQANRAAKKGDPAAAERWSKTAERLAAAAATMGAARAEEVEAARLAQEQAEEMVVALFAQVAYLAAVMVHAPAQAPAAFQGLIKLGANAISAKAPKTPRPRPRASPPRKRRSWMGASKRRCPISCARGSTKTGARAARRCRTSR